MCGVEQETMEHALLYYPQVVSIWNKIDELRGIRINDFFFLDEELKVWRQLRKDHRTMVLRLRGCFGGVEQTGFREC